MYLTAKRAGKPRDASDHDEIELLLEAYLQQTEELADKAASLISDMRNTEEIVQISLDVSRNSLMWFQIRVNLVTLSLSVIGIYGGIFGMNFTNHFEEHPLALGIVTGVALTSGLSAYLISAYKLKSLVRNANPRFLQGRALAKSVAKAVR